MWSNSFSNGRPIREVSGWELQNGGTIVMPFHRNGLHFSYNDYLEDHGNGANFHVKINDRWYHVSSHIHTHPSYNNGRIGLTGSSYDPAGDYGLLMYTGLPYMDVIYNNKIHRVSYNYYKNIWNVLKIWSW